LRLAEESFPEVKTSERKGDRLGVELLEGKVNWKE
jgi:hypothetical protein